VTPDRLVYLVDQKGEADKLATGRSTREEIQKAIDAFAKSATADDAVYIVLIGHGSFDGQNARFNLPGPDMNAGDFNALIKKLPAKQVVFVNAASASGPFVESLSGPGRTIITATRSGAEHYATLFGGFFVDAFTSTDADQDKNQRVTMLEAFRFAKAGVARAYEQEGLLATEHAMLDDNGDGEGSQDPTATGADGKLAAAMSLGSVADAAPLPEDPKLRALVLERRDLERRVESLRLLKESMPPAKYTADLEKLVTELALKTREIRTLEGAAPR
jgi:Peptidase C13 family